MFKNDISQRIYTTALAEGMPDLLAQFIVGQSMFEGGGYKHKFAQKFNSPFGYMFDKNSKWQIPGGSKADNGAPIAAYRSFEDATREITDWIKRRQRRGLFPKDLTTIKTPMDYATLLQNCGYYQGWKKYTKDQNRLFYANGIEKGIVKAIAG